MAKLSLQDVKDYLCIDFSDDATDRTLTRLIGVADSYLKGSVGNDYPAEDERAKQIALLLISDLYDNRGMNEQVSLNMRKIINDFSFQLRLELSRGVNVATSESEEGSDA